MSHFDEFLRAALIPRDRSHSDGTLDEADAILEAEPFLAQTNIFTAAVLGDHDALIGHISADASAAVSRGGPYDWDVLTHLCFSRYLQHRPHDGFTRCVRTLLDAGVSANTGFFEREHEPKPEWESVLYGACGVAHNPEITQLLVDAGADVNDGEVPYHSPETRDNRAMQILVNSGRMHQQSLQMMLVRKLDWHDYDGAKWLLEHGAIAHESWGHSALPFHFAILRDNRIETLRLLLEHGADPNAIITVNRYHGEVRTLNGIELAARCGRGDVLELLQERGVDIEMPGVAGVIVKCALGDPDGARHLIANDTSLVDAIKRDEGMLLMRYGLTGNTEGIETLVYAGLDINAKTDQGDGYWGIAKDSTALHAAAWRAKHDTVEKLAQLGADVNARDARGRSPMMLAVLAATDSYWQEHRSPASVAALLNAGASADGVTTPTGYDEIDRLLTQ